MESGLREITVLLPSELVERATKATGEDLGPTIRKGLEAVIAANAFERVRELRGKFKSDFDYDALRRDFE